MKIDVIKLIHKDNGWDKIYDYLKSNNIDPTKTIINGNNLIHLAGINNRDKILKYLLNLNDSSIFISGNDNNENILHILAYYGNNKMFKLITNKYPELLNKYNIEGNTPLYYFIDNHNMFEWTIRSFNINLDHVNHNNDTLLTININKYEKDNDMYYKNILSLIKRKVDVNIPQENLPIDIIINKSHNNIFKQLIDNGLDYLNYNNDYITPFISAVKKKRHYMVNLMLNKQKNTKSDSLLYYNGPEGDYNPVIISILNNDNKMLKILLDKKFNVKKYNRYLETPAHIALHTQTIISEDNKYHIMYESDLNQQNIEGTTPLHLLLRYDNWKNYSQILKNKKLDIFVKNKDGKTPLNYIDKSDQDDFIKLVVKSYYKQLNGKKCSKKLNRCKTNIIKKIFETKKSYPGSGISTKDFTLITAPVTHYGKFNSDSLHNLAYTLYFLNKYKNVGVPFQFYNKDKYITSKLYFKNAVGKTKIEKLFKDVIVGYNDFLFEISPYLILWRSKDLYYINKNMKLYVKKHIESKKIRYIFIKLTLVPSSSGTHANILLFDKETGIMERFDPYGYIPYLDIKSMDSIFENYFSECFTPYLKSKNKKFTYINPNDFMQNVSFQSISNDSNNIVKKLGDPVGYCLAWTYWYLEMRIKNNKLHPADVIKLAIKEILNKPTEKDGEYIFINFIRNYATHLDSHKNDFLLKCGIKKKYLYNLIPKEEDELNISKCMSLSFIKLMSDRI